MLNCRIVLRDLNINNGATNPCSSIFSLQNSYEIEVVGCTFQTLGSEGCKKGGAMSFELKEADGQLKMSNVGVTNSVCSSSEGCGGGIYLACATDNNDKCSFADKSIGGGKAHQGRDMYIVVNDMRRGVNSELFVSVRLSKEKEVVIERLMFDWTEWKNTTAFFGADKLNFTEGISLEKLLFDHIDTSVVVSSSGRDIHGCGSETEPCMSFWEGMRHFREGIQFREIKTNTSAAISDEWDLSNSSISSVVPSSPGYSSSSSSSDEPSSDECTIIVGKAIQSLSEPSEAALTNKLILTFTSINFCLPSFFETPQKELLFTETGTATLNKCSFAMQTAEEGIAFVLFHFISVGDAEEKGDEESVLSKNGKETKASKDASEIRLENLQWHLIRSANTKALTIANENSLSVMDFSELAFDRENAIFGSERIFVSGEKGKNEKDCGQREDPCETLSEAVRHLNDEPYKNVLVVKKEAVSAETAISSATVQTVGGSPAVFEFNCEIAQTDGSADCVVSSSGECQIMGMDIVFGPSFASAHRSVFGVRSGNLTISDCAIKSEELASRQQPSAEAFGAKQFAQSSFALSLLEQEAGNSFIEACSGAAVKLIDVCFKELSLFVVSGDASQSAHVIKCELSSLTVCWLRIEDCSVSFITPSDSSSSSLSSSSSISSSSHSPNSFESSANSLISVSGGSLAVLADICIEHVLECCEISDVQLKHSEGAAVKAASWNSRILIDSCVFSNISSQRERGSYLDLTSCINVTIENSSFFGTLNDKNYDIQNVNAKVNKNNEIGWQIDGICKWNSSSVNFIESTVYVNETSFENFSQGAISLSNSTVTIEMGMFQNNNPFVSGYPSLRRNILCSDGSTLNVKSVKGGDGMKDNASFWMLSEGCALKGILSEVSTPLFISIIEEVKTTKEENVMKIICLGHLLMRCNLSMQIIFKRGDEKEVLKEFSKEDYINENEICYDIDLTLYEWDEEDAEMYEFVLFGDETASSTENFIMKNKRSPQTKGDEEIDKRVKGEKSVLKGETEKEDQR
ncbi:uncharacterized protein MONOS_15264 [Monocercomonoides exilis]|uniref:uncharacterized protein n=1 Tax=Monocercomonoides exilis TaxID=2049356 RepID=UPI003559F832|nr:hypothetical protein MONOS_15264 [Monocercomonoides exilis]|eukprot:MONOS_15264.1-p1 / transcript=MONOS_15264.1 / gene=MONOS_15264 / organism=Monocercomonoides_exilis_PA203 / gene_product=unspecified product / transcript_product=unspecified product / location=Mono_scaffold01184:2624-6512(-) / protein_length=1032 / sequence_SO=supercontig / SO=protein_coding / is_pseudo=false